MVALLLAVGLALGGYCALLAWRRPSPPPASGPYAATAVAPLALPTRLPTNPDFGRVALAANDRRPGISVPVTVRVHGVPAGWNTASAGVALFPSDGSRGLVWLPLATAAQQAGSLVLQYELARGGEVVATLAAARAYALHSYLARCITQVEDATTIDIDATAQHTGFKLSAGGKHLGPFRITRTDDPHWLPMDVATTGLTLASDAPIWLWLGRGSYELCDPLQPDRRQPFAVPASAVIELSADLAAARVDRP